MNAKQKSTTVRKSTKRQTICVFRGLPSYKERLAEKLRNIKIISGKSIPLETLIERGINLALAEHGEEPLSGRIQGRYNRKEARDE